MEELLKNKLLHKFKNPINTAKDCELLSKGIYLETNRNISSTTLRRFFGLLPSKSNLSKYNLDTLTIFCGEYDYKTFIKKNSANYTNINNEKGTIKSAIYELSNFTLNSIAQKTLGSFEKTIPREEFNNELNWFIKSEFIIYPVIAPGGYGKSVALAHWVNTLKIEETDFLFCTASVLNQYISTTNNLNGSIQLKIDTPDNIYENTAFRDKIFILIIDSIDELSTNAKKIDTLLNYIVELIQKYQNKIQLKIIFSTRECFGNKILKPDLTKLLSQKKLLNILYNNKFAVNSNSEFSLSEIKSLVELNKNAIQSFQYHAIPFILKDLIRIPINLYFLFELLKKDSNIKVISSNSLNRKYLKEFVFNTKFAEYKEDIIWKTIDYIEQDKDGYFFNKNLLKKVIPIHLKRETEFYNAYKSLITSGIIFEERFENKYGIYTTLIGFKHHNFFYYLSALNQINKNEGLDYFLFKKICNSERNQEWKNNLISILFEIAYENEDYETLKDFCSLSENILSSLMVRFSVGNSLRINNSIRFELINKYASHSLGQTFFFEQFVDTNFINNNYELRIAEYLKNKQTKESILFGNSILFLAGFLNMDSLACKKQFEILNNIEPDSTIHPWPIGRKVAYQILHHYFIDKKVFQNIFGFIEHYLNIAYKNPNYLNNGMVEFELTIFIALILTKEYETIIRLYEKLSTTNIIKIPENLCYSNKYTQNIIPYLFSEFAKYRLGQKISDNYLRVLEKTVDTFPSTFDDFQYKIILKYFLMNLYKNNNIEKSKEYYLMALKLSEFAKYNFYKAFLFINNPTNDKELIKEGYEIIEKTEFDPEFFIH
jgi:hypothetical protein